MRGFLLAGWANPEELQAMRHRLELALARDALFQFPNDTIANLHHARATRADQMMLMPVVLLINQGKACHAVSEMKSLHHIKALEQLDGTINGCEIARALRQAPVNLQIRQRSGLFFKDLKNCPTRRRQLAGFPAQAFLPTCTSAL